MRKTRAAAIASVFAGLALVGAVVAFAASGTGSWQQGMGMMGGRYVYRPANPTSVRTIASARAQAQRFADRLSLRVDEVMQFQRNFYAKLVDSKGDGATEVLVDPSTGLVSIEYGPAMMWNTRYGMGKAASSMMGRYGTSMMHGRGGAMMGNPGGASGMMGGAGSAGGMMGGTNPATPTVPSTSTSVSLSAARVLAQRWLDDHRPAAKVEDGGDSFPGYYTFETLKDGKITGMMSVNASTGAVWPHWWHGAFVTR